jgi:hypothetical protein
MTTTPQSATRRSYDQEDLDSCPTPRTDAISASKWEGWEDSARRYKALATQLERELGLEQENSKYLAGAIDTVAVTHVEPRPAESIDDAEFGMREHREAREDNSGNRELVNLLGLNAPPSHVEPSMCVGLPPRRVERIAKAYFGVPVHKEWCIAAINKALREDRQEVEAKRANVAPLTDDLMREVQALFASVEWTDQDAAMNAQHRAICMIEEHARKLERAQPSSTRDIKPFGYWDVFNEVLYATKTMADIATEGGNKVIPLYEAPLSAMGTRAVEKAWQQCAPCDGMRDGDVRAQWFPYSHNQPELFVMSSGKCWRYVAPPIDATERGSA